MINSEQANEAYVSKSPNVKLIFAKLTLLTLAPPDCRHGHRVVHEVGERVGDVLPAHVARKPDRLLQHRPDVAVRQGALKERARIREEDG